MTTTEKASRHELEVSGMSCGSCVARVEEALREVAGVRSASADLGSGRATVEGDSIDPNQLVEAVTNAGYRVEPPVRQAHE